MDAKQIRMTTLTQRFDAHAVADVRAETVQQMRACGVSFAKGARIAVAVGSRGIASLADVVHATVSYIAACGAKPFIMPAMGSHGGATAEGQRAVLKAYGVDEAHMGCPVVSSMEVVAVDTAHMPRTFIARDAYDADGIVVINRVKPHTDFHGPVESGLMKMLVIGIGKHAQALEMHRYGVHGLRDLLPDIARRVLDTGKVLMGIGIVENAYEQVGCIRACAGRDLPVLDAELLAMARRQLPTLPMEALDLLVVDWMGKDISGTGMDTNIIGRIRIQGAPEPDSPRIRLIVVDRLTEASHGNALGVGLADIVTERLKTQVDWETTYQNVVTSGFLERGRMPIVAKDLREAVEWALRALGDRDPETLLAARIHSTRALQTLSVTPAVLRQIENTTIWEARSMETDRRFLPMQF